MKSVIALTGGIASGKSTVADFFEKMGAEIIDADIIAREVVKPNTPLFTKIINHFGFTILDKNQNLDRKKLRQLIIENSADKKWLEDILHPEIIKIINQRVKNSKAKHCVLVIPLLDKTQYPNITHTIVVNAPAETQTNRLIKRDGMDKELAEKFIATQATKEQLNVMADFVIENNGSLEDLQKKITRISELLGIL